MSEDENTRYHMPVENRGFALIFVNDSFKDSTEQSPRRGAEIDSQRLIQTFTKLHFSILAVKNQTTTETLAIIRKFATGKKRHEEHAVVVAFSTHGTQYKPDVAEDVEKQKLASDVIYCTDGIVAVSLVTSLLADSEGLKGKPKLFFFQACRGVNYDTTLMKVGDDVQTITMDLSGLSLDIASTSTVDIPLQKDMFIAYSSPPGYLALRHVKKGSFFITALHNIIMKHGNDWDLMTLMTLVNNRSLDPEFMVKEGQGELWETNRKCIPWMASMLRKEVWFN